MIVAYRQLPHRQADPFKLYFNTPQPASSRRRSMHRM